ncbi:MAG: alkaline phosphatase [Alphaproteobacteria bacterium]|jgi:alkaline phosphatase|nr:alkaline phosphatase [Alphaproteobacteria bacterium]
MRNWLAVFAVPALIFLASCASTDTVSDLQTASAPSANSETGRSAKNVILMVSDGAGFNGWLAADYYQGLAGRQSYQVERPDGTMPVVYGMTHDALNLIDASGNLITRIEDLPSVAGAVEQGYDPTTRWKRFENGFPNDFAPLNAPYTSYTDSAAAGTALMSGRKTANGRVNVDWSGQVEFRTIAEIAMERDRSAGAVASVMASHATPAAVIAKNASRNNYEDIFTEMVESDLRVIMGAGHPFYDASGASIEPEDEEAFQFVGGEETFDALTGEAELNGFTFIDTKSQFEALASGQMTADRVVGIARTNSTLQAQREGLAEADTPSGMAFNDDVPDLATMSLGALNLLGEDANGFFLMIEGGAVDWMGHANDMPRFIEEQIDFNLAIDAVIEWVEANSSWDETLLIITSDHETGGIWGEGTWTNSQGGPVARDRREETVRSARFDPTEDAFNQFLAVQDRGAGNLPGYQFASGNHTNELVPLWAIGPGSELFAEFTRTDVQAGELWGAPYGWTGEIIDNTVVFRVMEEVLH